MQHKWRVMALMLAALIVGERSFGLTVSGVLGMGSSTTNNEVSVNEGPFVQTYVVEKLLNSKLAFGAEHIRSLTAGLATSISYTGLLTRYYINASPVSLIKVEDLNTSNIVYRDLSLFLGSGVGFAQSSNVPDADGKSSNAAGIYISPRVGVDYQLGPSLGARAEFLLAMTLVGKGSISTMSLGAGLYYFF